VGGLLIAALRGVDGAALLLPALGGGLPIGLRMFIAAPATKLPRRLELVPGRDKEERALRRPGAKSGTAEAALGVTLPEFALDAGAQEASM
jgi:hypothetical protein